MNTIKESPAKNIHDFAQFIQYPTSGLGDSVALVMGDCIVKDRELDVRPSAIGHFADP
jgi:hypothetical protein